MLRNYAKGRNFYDFVFCLNRWEVIAPNVPYLKNALTQTGYEGVPLMPGNWRELVAHKMESANWEQVTENVELFLLRLEDPKLLEQELLLGSLRSVDS